MVGMCLVITIDRLGCFCTGGKGGRRIAGRGVRRFGRILPCRAGVGGVLAGVGVAFNF